MAKNPYNNYYENKLTNKSTEFNSTINLLKQENYILKEEIKKLNNGINTINYNDIEETLTTNNKKDKNILGSNINYKKLDCEDNELKNTLDFVNKK